MNRVKITNFRILVVFHESIDADKIEAIRTERIEEWRCTSCHNLVCDKLSRQGCQQDTVTIVTGRRKETADVPRCPYHRPFIFSARTQTRPGIYHRHTSERWCDLESIRGYRLEPRSC